MIRAPALAALLTLAGCMSPPDQAVVPHPALVRQSAPAPATPSDTVDTDAETPPMPDLELSADRVEPRPRADRAWQGIRPEPRPKAARTAGGWRRRVNEASLTIIERDLKFNETPPRGRTPEAEAGDGRRKARQIMLESEERMLRFRLKSDLFGSGRT